MIRALALAVLFCATPPAQAQEVTRHFGAGDPATAQLVVRSTTDTDILAPLLDAFVTAYPHIALRYEQWGSNALYAATGRACDKAEEDRNSTDVVISSGVHQIVDLVNRACARPYSSALTRALPAARRWRDEVWGITQEAAVTIYNTALVPSADVPLTRFALLDLLRRKPDIYRGRIATYDIEESGLGFLFAFIDSQQATTFGGLMEGFARVDAVATCCSAEIIAAVQSGQYLIAYNVLGSYLGTEGTGAIGVIYPQDYTLVLSRAFMIPRSAPHPENAALLLDFILSPTGQALLQRASLMQPDGPDRGALQDSIKRVIPISPTLLVAMDQARRSIVVENWRAIFGANR